MVALTNGLLIADVMHTRHRPKRNAFHYGVYYLSFALHEMQQLASALLSLGRLNLFSFYERDHGALDGSALEPWIRGILAQWNITEADGEVELVTLPRLFGYVFNPVSFWFCKDKEGKLRAVLCEVCNTFGERHCYLCFHDDKRPITQDDWLRAEKVFHVSPFMDVKGYYLFRFALRENKIGVWIDHYDADGLMLSTSVTGKRGPLTSARLLWCFFRYPLVTLKVVGLIHFQAVRLFFKGIRYRPKPLPPATEISR